MTIPARSSCTSPMAIWLPSNQAGSGHPHIMCPMEKYISTARKPTEATSLFFKRGVSRSFNISSCGIASAAPAVSAPPRFFSAAPYPAFSTARMISCGAAVPSTPMEFVRRLTAQDVTPGTSDTAFSTRALHAAQLIPVHCILLHLPPSPIYFINFWSTVTSSSTVSSLPSRISFVTQVLI